LVNPRVRFEDPDLLDGQNVIEPGANPELATAAVSISGEPFDRIAVGSPFSRNRRNVPGTSGKAPRRR